jgi:sec-independent protein translocase protein TatA
MGCEKTEAPRNKSFLRRFFSKKRPLIWHPAPIGVECAEIELGGVSTMGGLSIWHWMIVLVVVLLLFGTGKVSNLMGEFGKGIKTFKQNVASDDAKPQPDASMSRTDSLNAPLPEQTKTTVNQS